MLADAFVVGSRFLQQLQLSEAATASNQGRKQWSASFVVTTGAARKSALAVTVQGAQWLSMSSDVGADVTRH